MERLRQEREAARQEAKVEKEGREQAERLAMANMSASLRNSGKGSSISAPVDMAKTASHEDAPVGGEGGDDDGFMPPPPGSVSTRRRGLSSRGGAGNSSSNVSARGSRRGGELLHEPLEL